ncbi:MAG TPA: hypothetical protein VGM64_14780 [Lacunisphaera sp.]|jgi:hypothetical protein
MTRCLRKIFQGILTIGGALSLIVAHLGGAEISNQEYEVLKTQNQKLQNQVERQQTEIDELRQRLDALQSKPPSEPARQVPPPEPTPEISTRVDQPQTLLRTAREIRVSGEAGLVFFSSGPAGAFPNAEFRVDDAKLFFEAPVWKNVYFFTGLELTTREAADEYFHVGELYADMEDVLTAGRHYTLNLRAGRFNIPFGEEYQYRNIMANPLITHSAADIWGTDEGIQAYGSLGRLQYNLAVQNGGHKTLHDYNKDKSVTIRLGFDPTHFLHLSASAHRTGKLDTVNDGLSEIWLSNGFFRALGTAATTRTFDATLYELDAITRWKSGHFQVTSGEAWFDDDSTVTDDSRHLTFYSFELMQQLTRKLYGAVRYSGIHAGKGYPIIGLGNAGEYFYNPLAPRTTDLSRFSAGLGYQFDLSLLWKLEYSWESGHLVGGAPRDGADTFATELGLKF